jgi:hypothetical protein
MSANEENGFKKMKDGENFYQWMKHWQNLQ